MDPSQLSLIVKAATEELFKPYRADLDKIVSEFMDGIRGIGEVNQDSVQLVNYYLEEMNTMGSTMLTNIDDQGWRSGVVVIGTNLTALRELLPHVARSSHPLIKQLLDSWTARPENRLSPLDRVAKGLEEYSDTVQVRFSLHMLLMWANQLNKVITLVNNSKSTAG